MTFITFEDRSGKTIHINPNNVGAFYTTPHENTNLEYLHFHFNAPESVVFTVSHPVAQRVKEMLA